MKQTKQIVLNLILSAFIMLALPFLAVTFAKGDSGMAICFILFFAINPIYAICTGIYAGKDIKTLWLLPVCVALRFLLGAWIFFDFSETSFILYAFIYLSLGVIAMLISAFIKKQHK